MALALDRSRRDEVLIGALRKAHAMLDRDPHGLPTLTSAPASPYERKVLRMAFLSPDLQREILAGSQPSHINLERLLTMNIPLSWRRQREALGWMRSRSAPACSPHEPACSASSPA